MSAVDDVGRMLALVPWIIERPGVTIAEIASAFGVTPATVHRDLYHLDFCGLPGLYGGDLFDVSIVGDRVVVDMADELREPVRLTPSEALRLVLTAEATQRALPQAPAALGSAIEKLRAALGVPAGVTVAIESVGTDHLQDLQTAIVERSQVEIVYLTRGGSEPVARVVDPWHLTVQDGFWYLQAGDQQAGGPRTFRLDRIAELTPLASPATAAPEGTAPAVRYAAGSDDAEVVLDLDRTAAWIAESVAQRETEQLDDGRIRIRFRTDTIEWVTRLVAIAGAGAHVIEPAELRSAVRDFVTATLSRYEA